MLRYLVAGLVLVAAVGAAEQPPRSAHLVGKAPTLVAGRSWTATVRLTPPARAPKLVAKMGPRTARFPARRIRRGVYRAVVRLAVGSWRLWVQIGSRRIPLATVRVAPATLGLDQPAQILVARDGSILVAERGHRDRIVRVDPASGVVTAFARGLSDPFGLAVAPDGSILTSSGAAIHRIAASGSPAVEVVRVDAGPIVAAPNGDVYYANRTELGVVRAGAAAPQVFPVQVNAPHALVLDGESLFVADSGHGRILRVDPASGRAAELVTGLRAPLALSGDGSGGLLTAEYATGSVLRVSRAGETRPLASGLVRPYALAAASDAVYVVEAGELTRPTGAIKRVLADGTVVPLRLRRG